MRRGQLWPRYRHSGAEAGAMSNVMDGAAGDVSACRPKLHPYLADAAYVAIQQQRFRSLYHCRRGAPRTTRPRSVRMRSSLRLALQRSLNEPETAFLFAGDLAEAPSLPAQLAHFCALGNPFCRGTVHMARPPHLCSAEEAATTMNELSGTPPFLPLPPTLYPQTQ